MTNREDTVKTIMFIHTINDYIINQNVRTTVIWEHIHVHLHNMSICEPKKKDIKLYVHHKYKNACTQKDWERI